MPEHTCESKCPTCNKCLDTACTEEACADKCEGHTVVPEHTCESVCPTCGKCTDAACTEEACADKCEGHTVVPEHTCESKCPTCNKCLDTACTEEACADKCEGHTVVPEHTCESKCPTCNKCLDADCTETACAEKCEGHTVVPEHTCESKCPTCNKCLDADCTEEACEDKCEGHTPAPTHTCESKCPTCNKCLDATCTETACAEKCEGHTVVPEHTCESVCPTCNKCLDATCTEEACEEKCEGHTPAPEHTCESVCPTCNKCTDADCTEEACADKCQGHTVVPEHTCENVCETCGGCTNIDCTEEVCEDKCPGHTVEPEHTCESVCPTCNKCTDADCQEKACEDKCPGHTVGEWDSFDLSFMSFNINFSDSNPNQDVGATSWSNRKVAVLDFINNSGAHIIGLQEICDWNAESVNQNIYLQQNLADKYEYIYYGKLYGLGFVYDKTVFELVSNEHYWLSETPDVLSTCFEETTNHRIAAIIKLRHKASGEIVRAINTHGSLANDLGENSANVRSFKLIAERSLSGENDPLTVMVGDFNAQPNKLGYVPIAKKLQDCRLAAEEAPNRGHNSYNGYGKYADNPNANNPLDHCFVSKFENVKVLKYVTRTDRFGAENYYLSDHYAAQATIRVYNNSENKWTGFY